VRNSLLYLVGTLESEQGIADQYVWKGGKQIFETSTSHMRQLLLKQLLEKQIGIQKWRQQTTGIPSNEVIWRGVWQPFRDDKVNQFLWQIIYRIPATKHFVFSQGWVRDISRNEIIKRCDSRTWCERCPDNAYEDLVHLFWKCSESQAIWEWVFALMRKVGKFRASDWEFTMAQVLLGAPIKNVGRKWPRHLWEVLRGQTTWEIWFTRDKQLFDQVQTSREGTVMKIWTQIRQYLVIGWSKYRDKIRQGKLTREKAWFLFTKDYGDDECISSLIDDKLLIPYKPFGLI
jgi:hypothetical protein